MTGALRATQTMAAVQGWAGLYSGSWQDHGGGGTEVERWHLFKKYKLEGREG